MNEVETRFKLVDPKLHGSEWSENLIRYELRITEDRISCEYETREKAYELDYILLPLFPDRILNRILKTTKTIGRMAHEEINKRFPKSIKIPLPFLDNQPKLKKQKEIANYLDRVYKKIKALKEGIQKQINPLEKMKENILVGDI